MRIAHVLEASGGGAGRQVRLLAMAQQAAGHEVTLIVSDLRGDPDFTQQYEAVKEGGCCLVIRKMTRNPSIGDWGLIRELRELVATRRIQVLHGHCAKGGFLARLAGGPLRQKGLRVFHTPHSWYLHGLSGLSFEIAKRLERWLARRTDGFLCVSEDEIGDGELWGIVATDAAHLAVNGLPDDFGDRLLSKRDARLELGVPIEGLLVGTFSRLDARKGLHSLLSAAVDLPGDVALVIVGDGIERAALMQAAEELGVASRTHFLGYRRDAGRLVRALDVAVLPSSWEGRSLFALEALAGSVALVASNAPGNRFVTTYGGHLSEHGSRESLVACISDALEAVAVDRSAIPTVSEQASTMVRTYRS